MPAIINKIDYKSYYDEFIRQHPAYAKMALGFVPEGIEKIKIYLENGDNIIWNFIYRRLKYIDNSTNRPKTERPKRGRPRKEAVKTKQYRLRLTDEEHEMLMDLARRTGKNASDVLCEAMRAAYIKELED